MKTSKILSPLLVSIPLILLGACSSASKNSQDLATRGPTVLDVKTNPGTFDLNQSLIPVTSAQIVANVKDFQGEVNDVRLRFVHVPIEIPMKQVTPSTWVANLNQQQLKQLAVNGHTMRYDANVVARDNKGLTAISNKPVEISIKAADAVNATG